MPHAQPRMNVAHMCPYRPDHCINSYSVQALDFIIANKDRMHMYVSMQERKL